MDTYLCPIINNKAGGNRVNTAHRNMKTLQVFENKEFSMMGEKFSILQNEEGLYTLAIDGDYSNDFFYDKERFLKFAKRNIKNLSEQQQQEIMDYINTL